MSPAPRRERARAATIEEIKQVALALMREHGAANVRFTDIARAMEMTPPALYRYFADRDELLHELIADAYDELGRRVAEARDAVPADDIGGRFMAGAQEYRRWARSDPHRFALIFGVPIPGYAAPEEGPTTEAARRAMAQLASIFVEAKRRDVLARPTLREVHPSIAECARVKSADMHAEIPAESFQALLHAWAALHGFVCLEANGHFEWMDAAARDALFVGQLRLAGGNAGLLQQVLPTATS